MIPSILAKQIRQGLEDFLNTTFPINTPFFHGILERLLEEEGEVFKGPYLSLGLPFRKAKGGREFFPDVPLPYRPYHHQELAFNRLGGKKPASTIIATGTGSGKTECFLWPILDYCYKHGGEPGIKAILIYPMNALATDQAARIASAIYTNTNLRGNVTAGIYIGENEKSPAKAMGPDNIITDKDTLRLMPPDILLTNYKMLDYLLIRPGDFGLWQQNGPETLKFLVVDELHTFDGAQGTDLACLIRRLKARLKCPKDYLCCVGTSATLGSKDEEKDTLEYASRLFGEPFDEDAVIEEERISVGEFLEGQDVLFNQIVEPSKASLLDPERYGDPKDYILHQIELWFGRDAANGLFSKPSWQIEIGRWLKGHLFFQNLLKIASRGIFDFPTLLGELEKVAPELSGKPEEYRTNLLISLLSLVSTARSEQSAELARPLPFLYIRLEFWMRELRRMVCEVSNQPRLRFADDLSEEQLKKCLPLVHCRECGTTGWSALARKGDLRINHDLQAFYKAFFSENPDVIFIFPEERSSVIQRLKGLSASICPSCFNILPGHDKRACSLCGKGGLIRVFIPESVKEISRRGQKRRISVHDCPYCQSKDSLTILGSRAASLASVQIAQLFSSPFNDHKKLIAFSDSVQDAAHRAGFFTARTWRFNLRAAIQRVVEECGDGTRLSELPDAFNAYWSEKMDDLAFISCFIAPNMLWFRDFEYMKGHGRLPEGSRLREDVFKRISLEIWSEYGFSARIGRTLEKTGASIAYPAPDRLNAFISVLKEAIQNEIGELSSIDLLHVRRFLTGIIIYMKNRGAVYHPALESYLKEGGKVYLLSQSHKKKWMPNFGPSTRAPAFVSSRPGLEGFDTFLKQSGGRPTWFEDWAERCFMDIYPLTARIGERLFQTIVPVLVRYEFFFERNIKKKGTYFKIWGLLPENLYISKNVVHLRCDLCGHELPVSEEDVNFFIDGPCMRFRCEGRYERKDAGRDYYGRLYTMGDPQRIYAFEHTGLLDRRERQEIEGQFKAEDEERKPWYPNLLSCTPTLELGIDIGDLSTVILCSVPPAQANYLQRIGRAGRKDGNALNLTLANSRNHDLYFFYEPEEMIKGQVQSPGIFLRATAVLERQLTAFCFDRWVESGITEAAIPRKLGMVLNTVGAEDKRKFPYDFLHFIETHSKSLLKEFVEYFKNELEHKEIAHLERFIHGETRDEASLSYRVLDGLFRCKQERESLKKKVQALNRKIRQKESSTARDKNFDTELAELKREKSALQALIKSINQKDVLNFFTDEGLIPNYAFPEAGVMLRSVIYRKKESTDEKQGQNRGGYESWSYDYERPAASAISEFAPENTFYAGGRRVQIDQVDLALSKPETWRFCNSCSFAKREAEVDSLAACPKCGSTLWRDAGQKREMLRMRQVFAHTNDKDSRISDDIEDRTPRFYIRQMLVDFDLKDVEEAWALSDEAMPFGFEFISKATFREINFGEQDNMAEEITIAGKDLPRKGFLICKHCGKIQDKSGKIKHSFICRARKPESPENLLECVYLYREFTSEAIRILLPVSDFWDSERKVHSFIAALQLGLKERFRGSVDHLQVTVHEEPVLESGLRKKYLVIYDMIPGGTGYLKDLLRAESPIFELLETALKKLKSCSCNHHTHKDGCYRCLYAYRGSHYLDKTSRDTAVELLSSIMKHGAELKKVENLTKISINSLIESELEARFIEALRRQNSRKRPVTIEKQIVNGKPGYRLKTKDFVWYIELQAKMGSETGIEQQSVADFLFIPARSQKGVLPIALFTDGYTFHQDRIGLDMAQRTAIARSGKFHVWSLTWKDVKNSFEPLGDYYENFLEPTRLRNGSKYRKLLQGYGLSRMAGLEKKDSFEQFICFLEDPEKSAWERYAFLIGLMNVDFSKEPFEGSVTYPDSEPWVHLKVCVKREALESREPELHGMVVSCILDDRREARIDATGFEGVWNGFLRLCNLFQFLPASVFTTSSWSEKGFESSARLQAKTADMQTERGVEPVSEDWEELLELTDERLHDFVKRLEIEGVPVPESGFELTDANGKVVAQAELGWADLKAVVVMEGDEYSMEEFKKRGWVVATFDDALRRHEESIQKILGNRAKNGEN